MAYVPSQRIAVLRQRAMACDPKLYYPALRTYHYLDGWMQADGKPLPLRNAVALANVMTKMPVVMTESELLVGEHGNPCDFPNFGAPPQLALYGDAAYLTERQKGQLESWIGTKPFAFQSLGIFTGISEELAAAHSHGAIEVWGTDINHSIRNYEKVLRLGFTGIRAEIDQAKKVLPLSDPDAAHRMAALEAFGIVCDAALNLGTRHAKAARELSAKCADEVQRREWEEVAEVCDRVPGLPARTFREAVQSLWFAHMLTVWEDGVNANGIGRIDQFLWPYLERDLAQGRIGWDDAAETLAALWVKLYQSYDVQQMMVGGQTPDGLDATNPMSYLVLDITEGMGFVRCLSARLHEGTPRAFVERCVDLVAKGGGIPFFFNDEAIVPALVSNGIAMTDARDYAAIGCIEITIPGKANPHAVSNWVNLAKCLELAINDGKDLRDGTQVGPRTGSLPDLTSMEDVKAAFSVQLAHFTKLAAFGSNACELSHMHMYRLPYLSLLTEGCVNRGRDIIEGGALYNYHSSAAIGIPNVADSLAALELAVFSPGGVGAREMLDALANDFEGYEELRLRLANKLPKYGNDHPIPDGYAADITREFCGMLGPLGTPTGGRYLAHLFTFTLMLSHGRMTGASPDGRRAGEPLAYSLSPGQGRDREGLTAVINSLARIPHELVGASSSAILEADPALFLGSGKRAFVDLLITAVALGVGQLQFNVVSADTLRDAQAHPENHRNLCVRVSGFSQQFMLLDRQMQDHIIARTKHAS